MPLWQLGLISLDTVTVHHWDLKMAGLLINRLCTRTHIVFISIPPFPSDSGPLARHTERENPE
ncbi:predicted protein [Histoplasma capsulatum var. duboisii H88]|uniref:Predicted protein n=1 Tax=Ajellomyces capsulatus (strain H88) TaxID=544711 RepID=F0UJB5_AJEC8|nr:predicted protein [Histoplasma capsulatum var. duboisii H88]